MLDANNMIEKRLVSEHLVGKRLGSGFCFVNETYDCQFTYGENLDKARIEEIIKEEIEKDPDKTYEIKWRQDDFSYYIRFKETKNEKEKNIEKLIIIDMSEYSDEEVNKITQRIQNEIIDEDIEIKITEKISDVFLIPGRKIIK